MDVDIASLTRRVTKKNNDPGKNATSKLTRLVAIWHKIGSENLIRSLRFGRYGFTWCYPAPAVLL
ncbi:hypothetical protein Pan14r_13660 [Crateriforma conspicua]|uniref:Uncharacterized protein n=1 Tax=Crateriforma conspicua TaxID=2527996 RepID=A0A5C5Y6M2_9PLAN|nr:hypothetical protein Pan14r_13660 [Crateriforma conspicua]